MVSVLEGWSGRHRVMCIFLCALTAAPRDVKVEMCPMRCESIGRLPSAPPRTLVTNLFQPVQPGPGARCTMSGSAQLEMSTISFGLDFRFFSSVQEDTLWEANFLLRLDLSRHLMSSISTPGCLRSIHRKQSRCNFCIYSSVNVLWPS